MRSHTFCFALALLATGRASAAEIEYASGNAAPIRFHDSKPLVIVHQGVRGIKINQGLTDIDKIRTVTCKSAEGCLITAKVWVSLNDQQIGYVSAYVDNAPIDPPNNYDSNVQITQQSILVTTGKHTVQTKFSQDYEIGYITSWNIEYAKYERSNAK